MRPIKDYTKNDPHQALTTSPPVYVATEVHNERTQVWTLVYDNHSRAGNPGQNVELPAVSIFLRVSVIDLLSDNKGYKQIVNNSIFHYKVKMSIIVEIIVYKITQHTKYTYIPIYIK